jgi:hypothetical protein
MCQGYPWRTLAIGTVLEVPHRFEMLLSEVRVHVLNLKHVTFVSKAIHRLFVTQ